MSFAVTISSHRNNTSFCEQIDNVFLVVSTCNRLRFFRDFQRLFDFL